MCKDSYIDFGFDFFKLLKADVNFSDVAPRQAMRPGYAKRAYEGLKEQCLKIIKDLDYTGRRSGE
jgi:hypothetical protein